MPVPADGAGCMQEVWHTKGKTAQIVHVQKRTFYLGLLNLVTH